MSRIMEFELYEPIKRHFTNRGCVVRAEVMDCDVVALDGDGELHIIELKSSCNLTVILQAMSRFRLSPYVYVAIPTPTRKQLPLWKELLQLCEATKLGLLTVTFTGETSFVTEHLAAQPNGKRIHKKKQQSILRESRQRIQDFNTGGTTRAKRITVYRQIALLCADYLSRNGAASPRRIREVVQHAKVSTILQANVYGWFVRLQKGIYDVTEQGRSALHEFEHVLQAMRAVEYNGSNDFE